MLGFSIRSHASVSRNHEPQERNKTITCTNLGMLVALIASMALVTPSCSH